ncbi:MAG: hypothetical protein DRJ42_24115, partial [Deltaproteobacteria bacterium]
MKRSLPRTAFALAFISLAGVLLGSAGDTAPAAAQSAPADNPTRGAYERYAVASDHPLASNAGL